MLTTEARIHSISASERPLPRAEVLVTAGIVALLGIIILYGVGFAAPDLIHSAAHDTRHSISVPCH